MKNVITKVYGTYLNVLAVVAPAKAAETGFLLFCRPFRGKITPKQMQFFSTAEKFQLSTEHATIQAYRWGMGTKKILFLHGWQSHTYRWKAYIEALAADEYSIYSLDAPGHGLSTGNFLSVPVYAELIEKFIRENGPFDAVVGHSLGGFSLLYTIHQVPSLEIGKVVLLAPPGEASDFISVFRQTLGLSSRAVDKVLSHFVNRYNVGPEHFSTSRFTGSLKLPGLIVHDEGDAEAPHHYSVTLQKNWSRSRLITTQGFGHNLRSSKVVEEVVRFITESESKETSSSPVSSQMEKS